MFHSLKVLLGLQKFLKCGLSNIFGATHIEGKKKKEIKFFVFASSVIQRQVFISLAAL